VNVAIYTSISEGCAEFAKATTPSKLSYCLRHKYSLHMANRHYHEALVESLRDIYRLLYEHQMVWSLDADCLITSRQPIHEHHDLGPHVSVCEEAIVGWNRLNCGSVVWRATSATRSLIALLIQAEPEWRAMPCGWQTWLAEHAAEIGDKLTIVRQRAFNSVVWNHSGGGSHWHPGDLVYHPCGIVPHSLRAEALRDIASTLEATP
jgi:hypothetical protein